MDIAIAVFSLAKMGGLEFHCVRLAKRLVERGHSVVIYTTANGPFSGEIPVHVIARRGRTNHSRMAAFAEDLRLETERRSALVVACQKLPGADVLFCADFCLAAKKVPAWKRFLPRYRTFLKLERACCAKESETFLIMLSEPQAAAYREAWSIAPHRLTVIPPTLDQRLVLDTVDEEERARLRRLYGVKSEQTAWLWIGMQPILKGLDRAIEALALSQTSILLAAGPDPQSRVMRELVRKAQKLGCSDRLRLVGQVSHTELVQLYQAADLFVHPSRLDVTGTVIVEALGAGLPVVTTENCGYSEHVLNARAGIVLREAAEPREIAEAISVPGEVRKRWAENARNYVSTTDLTAGIDEAAKAIEALACGSVGNQMAAPI